MNSTKDLLELEDSKPKSEFNISATQDTQHETFAEGKTNNTRLNLSRNVSIKDPTSPYTSLPSHHFVSIDGYYDDPLNQPIARF